MALTITIERMTRMGRESVREGVIAFSSSYATGGMELTPANLRLQVITFIDIPMRSGFLFEYDYTNRRVRVFHPRAAIANTLAVSTPALPHASGATAVTSSVATTPDHAAGAACAVSGVAGVAAGAGAEVPNATNLSALTGVKFRAYGF